MVLLRKTIYRDSKIPHELKEGTALTHIVGSVLDGVTDYFNHPDELATIRKKGMDFVKGTSWYKEAEKVYASMLKGIEEDEKKLQ